MMNVFLLVNLILFVDFIETKVYSSNITDEELRTCTTYYSRSGSIYKDFFSIKNPPTENDTLLLDFHFSVLAASDAHILLAASESVSRTDPVYEVVIGAGGNTFCDIRRQQKAAVKSSIRRNGLLSAVDVKTFWLHITKDGIIEVGVEGEELPFISWIDADPLPITVFSFSTWSGIEAKWYFDCQRDQDTNERYERIKHKMTSLEKLRQDLLNHYDPYVRPVQNHSSFTDVNMSLNTNYVNLNPKKGIVEIKGESQVSWADEKLVWDPINYDGIEDLHIFRREIWQPDIVLYNSVENMRNIIDDTLLVVKFDGIVQWNASITLKAWCDAYNMDNWPRDSHTCSFMMGFLTEFDKMTLRFDYNASKIGYLPNSEWTISSVDVLTQVGWEKKLFDPPVLQLTVDLKRASEAYNCIFFTPYIIVAVSILLTFWSSPFGTIKISLGCMELLISSVMLIVLGQTIPSHSKNVPFLVQLYSFSLLGSVISILLSIIVINLCRNKQSKSLPHFVVWMLTSRFMKISFCLCIPTKKSNDEYDKLQGYKNSKNIQELWILLAVTIDRICFLIYLPIVIYSVVINYLK
ncbi:unnamed protein product [Brassicogethes aeneus]|uniref:Uncharacterized protein n=1 Tax=Brassicogethes aeneus TaxID=1431903 RepID=A0A9P0AXT3_BRAAE|nr:unnamed protein product [Brassicogethes aeneus]